MVEDYQIVLGKGIGQFVFGITLDEVVGILGQPDEEEEYNYDETLSKTLYYDAQGIDFTFEKDKEYKLAGISVSGNKFFIGDNIRVGASLKSLLSWAKDNKLGEPFVEEAEAIELTGNMLYAYEESNLYFWVFDGVVTEIQLESPCSFV